jgi:NAD(P)-dependent dehydrogenase (short-subunit alcohol dehydrogenase family)
MSTGLLEGRVALVLGLDEIGTGIACRFEREGARVLPGDGSDPAPILARADRLDVLVCNLLPPSEPLALSDIDDHIVGESLHFINATVAAMRAALPLLRESRRGRIVLVGHRYGESVNEALGAYNAAAWSLIGLARSAAVEWGQYQITTNVLLPLARTAEFESAHARRAGIIDRLVGQLPLRRVGDPEEDVGGAAALLASDLMCFVNGEVLHADGGMHVAGPVLNPARFVS